MARSLFLILLVVKCVLCGNHGKPAAAAAAAATAEDNNLYSVGAALRYLSKGVFADALTNGEDESVADSFRLASLQDSSDCVKRLICELSPQKTLDWDEKLIMKSIPSKIDYASQIIQFQLAADLGQKQPKMCEHVYSRCAFNHTDIMTLMRQRGTSLEIPTNSEYDCTVLFLWNRKEKKNDDNNNNEKGTTAAAPTKKGGGGAAAAPNSAGGGGERK